MLLGLFFSHFLHAWLICVALKLMNKEKLKLLTNLDHKYIRLTLSNNQLLTLKVTPAKYDHLRQILPHVARPPSSPMVKLKTALAVMTF